MKRSQYKWFNYVPEQAPACVNSDDDYRMVPSDHIEQVAEAASFAVDRETDALFRKYGVSRPKRT